MEKAKLTKAQAVAVIAALKDRGKEELIRVHAHYPTSWLEDRSALNGMDLDLLIRTLYYDYEVEQTAEERIKEYYDNQNSSSAVYRDSTPTAIRTVLKLLGKEIEGVTIISQKEKYYGRK
jgi:hypothetical protein